MTSITRMNYYKSLVTLVVILALIPDITHARSTGGFMSRHRRGSDQRLAELETILALSGLRGKIVTVPVGFGRIDPARAGRKRRSSVDYYDLQKLRRMLQAVAHDSDNESVMNEENDEEFSTAFMLNDDPHTDDPEDQLI